MRIIAKKLGKRIGWVAVIDFMDLFLFDQNIDTIVKINDAITRPCKYVVH